MALTLMEYDEQVGHHLHMIEAGAELCERHAKRLFEVPEFETRAADQLLPALPRPWREPWPVLSPRAAR